MVIGDKMSKCLILSKIFCLIAVFGFITYLCSSKSVYMALGGLSLTIGSILLIIDEKKNE